MMIQKKKYRGTGGPVRLAGTTFPRDGNVLPMVTMFSSGSPKVFSVSSFVMCSPIPWRLVVPRDDTTLAYNSCGCPRTSSWMELHLLTNPLRLGHADRQHDIGFVHMWMMYSGLKILEYGLDLGHVVGARVELVSAKPQDLNLCPGTCIPPGARGSHLVHRPQSKLPALGIALCGDVTDWHPLARLESFAFFPGVENPDLATGMQRSPTNSDDFARSPKPRSPI